jgi:large subunit ribosomal protein L10e
MAHRRPWRCYAPYVGRSYQYKRSWNHKREYARGGAESKIARFWGGDKSVPLENWEIVLGLKCSRKIQVSSNALEAIRVAINSALQDRIGKDSFHLRIRPKPFHKFRENRMLAFAGADRVQRGMRMSFGRPGGVCARVRAGAIICEVGCDLKSLDAVRDRLRVASMKVPCKCSVVVTGYKTLDFLKKTGLTLYDASKHREIPVFDKAFPTA